MSIASEITRIRNNIASAYEGLEEKGASVPETQNSANLRSTINSIPDLSDQIPESLNDLTDGSIAIRSVITASLPPETDTSAHPTPCLWLYNGSVWYVYADETTSSGGVVQHHYSSVKLGTAQELGAKADQTAVEDIKAYIGYTDGDILGLQADFENSVFTRLAGAVGKTAGSDFDAYPMFGNRRRCNVEANGNIRAYYGDSGYYEDGNGGQVMVYQPAFFYKVVPLKLEKNTTGLGYHIRKANYYVSATPKPGFKRHPLFYDEQGNEIDYVLLSAYEGSMFDVSETAYVNDSVDTVTYGAGDLLCSVAGKKPISGKLTGIGTKANLETMANNYGSGWHLDTIKSVSANQLLMMIELGTLNTQTAIGQGVVNQSGSSNASSLTGSTSALGSATGMASQTTAESAGTETVNTTNGKLSVSYRGVENPWGNIWKHVNGINIWGDGTMGGGQIYIADGFTFNESSSADPYRATGISIANSNGYISAFGYGDEEFDWLLVPSECGGNSSLPVGDYCYVTSGLNGYRIVHWGGLWNSGDYAGGCGWRCTGFLGNRDSYFGGRLLYIPQ